MKKKSNTKPIRIAHLTPAYFSDSSVVGGGERYVHYIAHSLKSHSDIQQCIFTIGTDDRLVEQDGIPVRILRNDSPRSGAMNGLSGTLWRELRQFDLVHIHQSLTLFGAYVTAILYSMGIPMVGTDLGGGEEPLMLDRHGLDLLDGVVSISQYAHDLIGSFYSGYHEVLIGPVDTGLFVPPANPQRNKNRVLCVSRILPHKGIDQVIEALPEGLSLTVVGRNYHQDYFNLLQNMAHGKDVTFVEDADDTDLLELYQTSGVFVQASTARDIYGNTVAKPELMGLTTLEAMSCGLPSLVANTGSLPELVPDARFGRVFSTPSELSKILQEYIKGGWPDSNAESLARAHVVKEHSMNAIGSRLVHFYRTVLESSQESTNGRLHGNYNLLASSEQDQVKANPILSQLR